MSAAHFCHRRTHRALAEEGLMRARLLFFAILVVPAGAAAQEPSSLVEIFEAANVAASRGDYADAIANYSKLTEAGVRDPDVYFNLATSFAESGDYARAILNYERTLTVDPNDRKAAENLRDAEKVLEERRAEAEGEATIRRDSSISDAIYGSLSENALAFGLLLANLVFFVGLGWALVRHRRDGWLFPLLLSSGAVLLFCAVGLGAKAGLFRDGPRAIALDDRIVLREGPDPRARERGEARGGDRAEVIARDGDFVKLRVVNGLEGWTPASGVGLIDLGHGVH